MPAANQFRLPAFRTRRTGVSQAAGGHGDSLSWIVKSPSAASGPGFVLRSTNGARVSHMSVAKTLRPAVPPVGVSTTAVPTVSPPANTRPRPSTAVLMLNTSLGRGRTRTCSTFHDIPSHLVPCAFPLATHHTFSVLGGGDVRK